MAPAPIAATPAATSASVSVPVRGSAAAVVPAEELPVAPATDVPCREPPVNGLPAAPLGTVGGVVAGVRGAVAGVTVVGVVLAGAAVVVVLGAVVVTGRPTPR